jgi:hypothetical protein
MSVSSVQSGPLGPDAVDEVRMTGIPVSFAVSARKSTAFLNCSDTKSRAKEFRPVWWSISSRAQSIRENGEEDSVQCLTLHIKTALLARFVAMLHPVKVAHVRFCKDNHSVSYGKNEMIALVRCSSCATQSGTSGKREKHKVEQSTVNNSRRNVNALCQSCKNKMIALVRCSSCATQSGTSGKREKHKVEQSTVNNSRRSVNATALEQRIV